MLDHSQNPIPFDGMQGFYKKDFPLYQLYVKVFMNLFKEYIPDLYHKFDEECFQEALWLQKFLMCLFLYNFQ